MSYFQSPPAFAWLEDKAEGWQFGEQGLIDAILGRIGDGTKQCIEIGAGDGDRLPVTVDNLIKRGWRATLFEKEQSNRVKLIEKYSPFMVRGEWRPLENYRFQSWVAVIDIDSYDWLVLVEVAREKPALIVCEHADKARPINSECWIPSIELAGKTSEERGLMQATESALEMLVAKSYYKVCSTRVNSFFVRSDLLDLLA